MPFESFTTLDYADDASMFELAPVSLWLEDASGVRTLFESWRVGGMHSLRDWLRQPGKLDACLGQLKVLKVNQKTLQLFEATDFTEFTASLSKIITPQSLECIVDQWVELWSGQSSFFGKTVNTTLNGRVLDVQLRGNILPGHEASWSRVLVAIEDVTELERARREAALNAVYAQGLFEHSPVALWVKDFSVVKSLLDEARARGIVDLASHFRAMPDFARRCVESVVILDVNRQAIRLFGSQDKQHLLSLAPGFWEALFYNDMKDEIIGLWGGKTSQQRDIVSRTLDGREIYVQSHLSVLSGHENDWGKVQIARIDISERKKAEERLRYIGMHDSITKLYNRTFFAEKMGEIEASAFMDVTLIIMDLNGLKTVNDVAGHAAGDALLTRFAGILSDVAVGGLFAARLGGDEFALLMPNADEAEGESLIRLIDECVERDNQNAPEHPLSISVGAATRLPGERLESTLSRADKAMYDAKAMFYATHSRNRRTNETLSLA